MIDNKQQEEFLRLLDTVFAQFSRFARGMSKSREDARDLVSETILIVYENFDKIKNTGAFKSYLYTTAIRLARRKSWRLRIFGKYDTNYAENLRSFDSSTDNLFDVEALYKALDKLPIKQREAIVMFEISGFSLEEIQNIQGGTLSGVKSRLKRGREALKQLLNANEYESNSLKLVTEFSNNDIIHKNGISNIRQLNEEQFSLKIKK